MGVRNAEAFRLSPAVQSGSVTAGADARGRQLQEPSVFFQRMDTESRLSRSGEKAISVDVARRKLSRCPTMTSARDEILDSVRSALKHGANMSSTRLQLKGASIVEIKGKCERKREQLIEQFETEVQLVGARFCRAADEESVIEYIKQVSETRQAKTA